MTKIDTGPMKSDAAKPRAFEQRGGKALSVLARRARYQPPSRFLP